MIPWTLSIIHKVERCLERYSPRTTTTNQQTSRAPNDPARPICAQESIFWGKDGCFWAKHPYYFWRERSGTYILENHSGTSFALFFGRAWDQMDHKGLWLAQNDQKCIFFAKICCFRRKQKFCYPHSRKPASRAGWVTEKPWSKGVKKNPNCYLTPNVSTTICWLYAIMFG